MAISEIDVDAMFNAIQPKTVAKEPVETANDTPPQSLDQCVCQSTSKVFNTMCNLSLVAKENAECVTGEFDIQSKIELQGGKQATITLHATRQVIADAAEAFLGMSIADDDAALADFAGELTNMIGGNAKSMLSQGDIKLGLPEVETKTGAQSGASRLVLSIQEEGSSVDAPIFEFGIS